MHGMRYLLLGSEKGGECQFHWLGLVRALNQFETGVPPQLKRSFAKRTAYREQRAIITSHSSTPNTRSWPRI